MPRLRSTHSPMPLSEFPEWKQQEIAEAVARPLPPPRWIDLGSAQITSRAWFEWHRARGRDPLNERERLPQHIRAFVIERDGLMCGLCGGSVESDDVHIDHVIPWSLGGSDDPSNLQVAHSGCNMRKGARV